MLIIEDGTGKENAQSYIDVDFAINYFALRGITDINITEAFVVRAMDFFESIYGQSLKGERLNETQSLSFPRLIDGKNTYPTQVKNAICELALKASTSTLLEDEKQAVKRKEIGTIKIEYKDSENISTQQAQQIQYSAVYNLIKPYLNGSSCNYKVVRA